MRTQRLGTVLASVALLLAAALLSPRPARAQAEHGTLVLDAGAGIGLPVGDLGKVSNPGPAFDFGTSYVLGPSVALRAALQVEINGGATGPGGVGPTVRMFHLLVGPAFELVRSTDERRLGITGYVGVGGTALTTGKTLVGTGATVRTIDISKFYPAVAAQLEGHYRLSPSVALFLAATGTMTFAKQADTEPWQLLNPSVGSMTKLISVPITAGFRLTFPK